MEVRRAEASDVDAIAEAHVRAWQEAYVWPSIYGSRHGAAAPAAS